MISSISAINKVLDHWKCGKVFHRELQVTSSQVDDPQAVWKLVRGFPFDEGWLCLTDRVAPLYSGTHLTEELQKGTILSGELVKGSQSLQIRQSGAGWAITQYTVREGEGCLMLQEEYISTENGQRDRLNYDVYWRLDGSSYRPWAARFTGFGKGGDRK